MITQIYYNTLHLIEIAEHLPNIQILTFDDRPFLSSDTGFRIGARQEGDRLIFTPMSVMANSQLYPTAPPQITVDGRRSPATIAAAIIRRLLPPTEAWYSTAQEWRTIRLQNSAATETTRQLLAPLGSTSQTNAETIYGYDPHWQAQIGPGYVSVNFRKLPADLAVRWIKELQTHDEPV